MTKVAVEHLFQGATCSVSSYDPTKTNLGQYINQFNLGGLPDQKFAGPNPIVVGRPMEAATAIPCAYPCAFGHENGKQYIWFADNATAAATRRVVMYEYDPTLNTMSWVGFITITFPSATNFTIRGMRVVRYTHSTGTVAVSGTAVTGTGTGWKTAGMAAGARIGFGSTNPAAITQWYQITPASAISTDTAITLATSAGTIAAGTPYVIEDYRVVLATTNATTTNGGLFIVKGLSPTAFISTGTAVPAATTVDNIRAAYWLADASTVTNVTAVGVCVEPDPIDATTHYCYVLDSTGIKIYKYNMRKALTLTGGKDTTTLTLVTGSQAVTGTISTNNNGRLTTLNHGPGSGVTCIYFVTTTRIYRVIVSNIVNASTTFLQDSMTEVPPGGTATFTASGAMSSIEIASSLDRIIVTTTGANGSRQYVTQYRTDGGQMEAMFGLDNKQTDQGTMDAQAPLRMLSGGQITSAWVEAGICYLCQNGTATNTNVIHVAPISAHWTYASATGSRLITPSIAVPGATKLHRVYVNEVQLIGGNEIGTSPEPYRVYARTSGITDNSGGWTLLTQNGDISGLAVTGNVQFAFEFKILGDACIPSRILGVTVLYETGDSLPSQLQWNFDDSDKTTGIIGFNQKLSFGGSVPSLQIDYYRNDTDANVLSQASTGTTNGVFEYWNGSSWTAGLGTDAIGTRRRFRPTAGLPASVAVYPKIKTI